MTLHAGQVPVRPVTAWDLGVRARLLLAFFGITAFAVLAAAVGIYAFRQVGQRLEVVNTRVPPTITSLELSRSAERIIAAAPALLAATDQKRRDDVKAQLETEVGTLKSKLLELQRDGTAVLPLGRIEPVVTSLTGNLVALEDLVARRLDANDRIRSLMRGVFQSNDATQRLLAPWLMVTESQIMGLVDSARRNAPGSVAVGDPVGRLAALVLTQRPAQNAERAFSSAVDMLAEASTTDQERRLPVLAFQLGRALRDMEGAAQGMDPKLRPLFLEQVAKLREFVEGPTAIPEARKQELALIAEGERRLAENAGLAAQLTSAVDELSAIAKADVGDATRDALSVQRISTRVLILAVALSLLTSILIVWLYVGRNVVRRLTALSDGMLAIAGGKLDAGPAPQGTDEIAAMGRAVEIFRRNAVDLQRLLEERKQAAARLEETVKERTRELTEALRQQTATADVLKTISRSTFDLQAVLDTLVQSAARLCEAEKASVMHAEGATFRFVASYGFDSAFKDYNVSHPFEVSRGALAGRVVLERRTIHIPDVLADADYARIDAQRVGGYRSMLGVPLLREGVPIGVIVLLRAQMRPFTDKQIELVTTFADQAVIAIENVRLFEEVQARTRELTESLEYQTATSDVLNVISRSPSELQPVLDTIVETAGRLCKADFAYVFQLREDGKFHLAAADKREPRFAEFLMQHPIVPGRGTLTGRVAVERRTIHVKDATTDPDYHWPEWLALTGFHTFLSVPLMRDGTVTGVIALARTLASPFSDKQIELVTTFADQAVIAIENVRLFEEVQTRTRELQESLEYQTATADVLNAISRSPSQVKPVLDAIVETARRLCEAYDAAIFLRDGSWLSLAAHQGPIPFDFDRWKIGRGWVTGRAVVDLAPVHVLDLAAAANEFPDGHSMALRLGHRTTLSTPLLREGDAIGAIALRRTDVRPFSERQIGVLQTFADQAVIAIENARLFGELQARTEELTEALQQQTATADVLKTISRSTFDLKAVLHTLVESAAHLCDADKATITRQIDGVFYRAEFYGFSQEFVAHARTVPIQPAPGSVTGRALLEGKIVHIPDVESDPDYTWVEARELGGFRTILGVPMLREEVSIGVLTLARSEVRPFTQKQIDIVATFADQAAIAIENVRLFEEVQARTAELQESLEYQTAISDVLGVISRSPNQLQPVLDTIVAIAARICRAYIGDIILAEGDMMRVAATIGDMARPLEPIPLDRSTVMGRSILDREPVHVEDLLNAGQEFPLGQRLAMRFGHRTILGVPLLRSGLALGAILLRRDTVQPFSDRQIELLKTFADQAVIAIENTRLFDEVQTRNRDLRISLDQQTATSELLKVIGRFTSDLKPVFGALADSAVRLCGAERVLVFRFDGQALRLLAWQNVSEELFRFLEQNPIIPGRHTVSARAALERRTIRIEDVQSDPEYTYRAKEVDPIRSALGVPMTKGDELLGVITIYRHEVDPFTDSHVTLMETFADQAVIAIENVRLFEQLEARTQELAQSLDDLRATQDRLIETQKLASLGQLTAGIAHEIKNPLNFVNNFAELSNELIDELEQALQPVSSSLDPKARDELEDICATLKGNLAKVVQHGRRADSIVKNMLLHSRERGGERRMADLNALVEEALNLAYHGARAEKPGFNITLSRTLDPAVGQVAVFPQELTRVLLNLISNGFHAAHKKKNEGASIPFEPTLAVSTRAMGQRIKIKIRDNGTGIPDTVRARIFEPFFTTKPPGEGTGLGLSISHDIVVKQHGGKIDVATRPGEFTEFTITLRRTAVAEDRAA